MDVGSPPALLPSARVLVPVSFSPTRCRYLYWDCGCSRAPLGAGPPRCTPPPMPLPAPAGAPPLLPGPAAMEKPDVAAMTAATLANRKDLRFMAEPPGSNQSERASSGCLCHPGYMRKTGRRPTLFPTEIIALAGGPLCYKLFHARPPRTCRLACRVQRQHHFHCFAAALLYRFAFGGTFVILQSLACYLSFLQGTG